MATSHRSPRHVFGAALAGARDVELRDAATDPVPEHRLGATRVIIGATGVAAAVALSWSLNLEPGQALFYPATFLVAVIYGAGIFAAGRVGATRLRWRADGRELLEAFGIGIALALLFVVGALLVRFIPALRDPVSHLLDHARMGSLPIVALTTAVNGIAEEVFYRGGLWRVLSPRKRVLWTTVAYTAVTALTGIPLLALAAAMLGFVVAVLRQQSGSLAGPIVTHLTWSMLMLFVLPHVV